MNKRFAFKLAFAGAAALALTACGEKTEPPKAAEPAKTAAAPAAAKEPLKVAFMYVSPANEEGWSTQHDIARRAVEAKFGDKIKVTTVENIPENADAERVLRDLAQQGNKLIFATSFGYMNSVLKVAKEFPDVKFEHATGYKTAPNVANYSPLSCGQARGCNHQVQYPRLCCRAADSGSASGHQCLYAWRSERQSQH